MIKNRCLLLLCVLPITAAAQDCAALYSYFKEGATFVYTNYNKKGKVESITTQRVSAIEEQADTLIASFDATAVDEDGDTLYASNYPVKCHAGVVYMDMRAIVPPQAATNSSPDIQLEVQGTDLTFPSEMTPGQTLPDSEIELTTRLGGMKVMAAKYFIKNRKVEAVESVTTPAGTFECLKISYDFEYQLLGKRTMRTEYWYAPAVGMVKSVNYDKRGNPDSRIELTRYSD